MLDKLVSNDWHQMSIFKGRLDHQKDLINHRKCCPAAKQLYKLSFIKEGLEYSVLSLKGPYEHRNPLLKNRNYNSNLFHNENVT